MSMIYPQVTVIVPVYNTSAYLRQSLETITNQTLSEIEIICVNDGSNDSSLDILKEFAARDNRIVILSRERASGSAARPRNMGLDIAKGKYVICLDSDDYFDTRLLEKLVERAEETGAELVLCNNYIVQPDGQIENGRELCEEYLPKEKVFSHRMIPATFFQFTSTSPWHRLMRREMIERYQLRYQERVPILDDICFVDLQMSLSERISIIRDRLVYYRVSRPGAQTTAIAKHKESVFWVFQALNDGMKKYGLYKPLKFSLQNQMLQTLRWWLYATNDYGAFTGLYKLYREEYFPKLGLTDIEPDCCYGSNGRFYREMAGCGDESPMITLLRQEKPCRIALYGAGAMGHNVRQIIETQGKHRVTLWCDRDAPRKNNPNITLPETLKSYNFDAVIIALGSAVAAQSVKQYLLNLGIDKRNIYAI